MTSQAADGAVVAQHLARLDSARILPEVDAKQQIHNEYVIEAREVNLPGRRTG
ncbi:hypothetical protein AB0L68_36530 [Streptomyces sp. NPDC052164]|uniref:hypothetical protein n=1 Tax=Streptomyces sp. NPDC052164 TaxID=3155529 RepID=UPI003438B8F9